VQASAAVSEVPVSRDARDLLVRHREGDRNAFAALVGEYRRPVYGYLVRCGIPEADRDDLFQAVFMRIHRSIGTYRPDRPAHPWLFTVVANEVRTYLKRKRIRGLVFGNAPAPGPGAPRPEPADAAPDGERALAARETVAWLEREIRCLPVAQREVLLLAGVESLPLKEVAEVLGIPLNTVKTHLRRARLRLSERLARRERPGAEEAS
jgi:RNA polymerase sigma-70 factor (ECF subfamily)